ncbi:MAG: hypothetical protein J4N36_05440 [Chloroflexi bacterium]|nr:hypothetical protein [Chloroflexota bacterium]
MVALTYALFAAIALLLVTILAAKDAEAHNWYPDDGCAPGTSPDGYFWAGGPASGWGTVANGWNGCSMWTITKNVLSPPDQFAEWYTPTTSNYTHRYKLAPYIPDMGATCAWLSTNAHYHRYENGTVAGISSHDNLDQSQRCTDNCWQVTVGLLNGSNGGKMDVWDSTGEAAARFLMVDLFCFIVL